jgi:ATP-dependent DNA helicase RecG
MPTLKLDTPLFEVLGAKNVFLKRLEKLGIKTLGDALQHFPVRYEDFSHIAPIAELAPGTEATVQGIIQKTHIKNAWRRRMAVTEAIIEDESGTVRAVWFNQPYIANALAAGRMANFSGKVSLSREGEIYFSNPSYEVIHENEKAKHTGRLVPVYPETKGLTSRGIRFIMTNLLKRPLTTEEWIPREILETQRLPDIVHAYAAVHFPRTIEEASWARRRFLFENLFLLQLTNLQQKQNLTRKQAPRISANIERIKMILEKLPFELTPSQKRSLWEIIQDMGKNHPMNRLLQGDVGSGKTIVAALAAMIAAEQGFQTAFMAPTEILARQHFETFQKFLKYVSADKQPITGLVTGSNATIIYENDLVAKNTKDEFWKNISTGKVVIIFGTHALIAEGKSKIKSKRQKTIPAAKFKNLGLVIVDEQHRFGVKQRKELLRSTGTVPHFLSMSATPIPRTIMMTVFGDLDVSLITELPSGRKAIETEIVIPEERKRTYAFVRKEITAGRQAFVICPRIEESEKENEASDRESQKKRNLANNDVKMVTEEYEKLSKKIFPDLAVGMLHGKMKPKEKEETMRRFSENKINILVSTSVIEVGVDVPNATIMMVESAERFGLAQLYQFRGRVGRGNHQSYCFLFTESTGTTAKARLAAIVSAKNGFELAEKDLALRGPGEFFGEAQSGFSDTAIEALRDPELVKISREAAGQIINDDPLFTNHGALKDKVLEFQKKIHLE